MSDLDDSVRRTQEYIDEAQQVIAKINDMLASLNKLIAKNSDASPPDAKRLAKQAKLEDDLQALVQGYLGEATSLSTDSTSSQMSASQSGNAPTTRPGRFRPRI